MPLNAAVIVKHNNPCGAALGSTPAEAYTKAFACDTVSAFGGIVAFHAPCDGDAAAAMADVFTEVVVAPSFTDDALAAFAGRQNLRVVQAPLATGGGFDVRPIPGGALVQDRDLVAEATEGGRRTGRSCRRASRPSRSGATWRSRGRWRGA